MDRSQIRTYQAAECVSFRSTKAKFGGLSNMAGGFPLRVNGILVPSAEALYQACRFPHRPDVQRLIIDQKSPMTAKMVGKPHRGDTRPDWDNIRVRVMRWVLRVKLAMHWPEFGRLLRETGDMPIVEDSRRDDFWGAMRQEDGTLIGMNVLGRLLMELREELKAPSSDALRVVDPPPLSNFMLFSEPIRRVGFAPAAAGATDPDTGIRPGTLWDLPAPAAARAEPAVVAPAAQTTSEPSPVPEQTRTTDRPMAYPKRLIEVDLPIKRISAHARREKSIRHGHIATLHIWWARRPLAACRAVLCAALWPDPADPNCPKTFRETAEREIRAFAKTATTNRDVTAICDNESWKRYGALARNTKPISAESLREFLLDFVADFAAWEASTSTVFLHTARAITQAAHEATGGAPGTHPLVVDPFAGGGAIPLEALRVGAGAFASDLNPVAVLLNKVVLEYIPKYGTRLANEVRTWGQWIKEQAEKELTEFYPKDADGATPIAYIWARTVTCEGPGCGAEIPLIRNLWLAKKGKNSIALRMVPRPRAKRVDFEIVEEARAADVGSGTVARGSATCPCCGFTTKADALRRQLKPRRGGAADARLLAVATTRSDAQGRFYRLPNRRDLAAVEAAVAELARQEKSARSVSLVPDEPYPDETAAGALSSSVLYGPQTWGDLFTPRQALSLTALSRLTRELPVTKDEFGAAVRLLLAFAVDKLADLGNSMCAWEPNAQCPRHLFGRQAIPITWDFAEGVPLGESSGSYSVLLRGINGALEEIGSNWTPGQVERSPAQKHPLPDDMATVLFTDPPYYDAIAYGDLSDFFYVWLRRTVRDDFPALFAERLVDKEAETVQLSKRFSGPYAHKTKEYFEKGMEDALTEGRRVVAPTGIGIVVFAHKSTAGWEAQLQAMVNAGWTITGSWPVDTECGSRMNAMGTATLASSVHLVCRPREAPDGSLIKGNVGDWREVLAELPRRIHEWMPRLAQEGVVGADAIFACLGPALEVFSRYSRVEKASGEQVSLRDYLEQVWGAVSQEALRMVFEGADASGFEEDARLTAMWLWTLGSGNGQAAAGSTDNEADDDADGEDSGGKKKASSGYALEYDAARKIAQGLGAHLEALASVVEVKGETARLLPVAERTKALFGKDEGDAPAGRKKKSKQLRLAFDEELEQAEAAGGWGQKGAPKVGETVLDRVHQTMILFAAGRSEAMRRFLVEEGVGRDGRFWTLAQALSALYPAGSDERRWVDGVLARKKGLGF